MKVTLLSYTQNAPSLCAEAAQVCYSKYTREERIKNGKVLTPAGVKKRLEDNIESGHHSVIEHASYTFELDGVSRALTHQLVRHRLASFSQQSQRYVNMDDVDFVYPDSMSDQPGTYEIYEKFLEESKRVYSLLTSKGVPKEDARYVLPNATTTNIVVTMNARELLHFFELRMCNRAQTEIREVANIMYSMCLAVSPEIFEHAGPKCWFGKCTEKEPCGKPKPLRPMPDTYFGTLFC